MTSVATTSTRMLPEFRVDSWRTNLEGDPEGRSFRGRFSWMSVATEVIEPWAAASGTWKIFRSVNPRTEELERRRISRFARRGGRT